MNVYFALLALLADGPRSGLWLREKVAAGPGGMPPLNARQVYPALARLKRAGLVEPSGSAGADDPRQEFRITAGGQRELAGWLRTTPAPAATRRCSQGASVVQAECGAGRSRWRGSARL
jgi:DNA-binding PadR family transcriptional regulator